MCELDGAWSGGPAFEVVERGDLHLVVTDVVPVGGGADNNNNNKKSSCCSVFDILTL